MLKCFNR